ncbi:hypothetical protein N9L68_05260 [bacterium]|nr:hypothetical protein [bacterium]
MLKTIAAGRLLDVDLSLSRVDNYATAAAFTLRSTSRREFCRRRASNNDPSLFADEARVAASKADLERVEAVEWIASVDSHQVQIVEELHRLLELHFPKPLVKFREPFLDSRYQKHDTS